MHTRFVNPWLQYWQVQPQARIRLFCFPYAGGGASIFRNWVEYVPAQIEVCPVQLPGREGRILEAPFSCMDELVEALVQVLFPLLDMPYAFFGHSMGSLICFELARSLRRFKQVPGPIRLCVSGHRAPQIPDRDAPTYQLSDAEFIEELRRLKGTPEEILQNAELLQLLLPMVRADFSVCNSYRYISDSPLVCPISAFGGLSDDEATREEVIAWREQTHNFFSARFFAGDHFFLHKEQASLMKALTQDLLDDI